MNYYSSLWYCQLQNDENGDEDDGKVLVTCCMDSKPDRDVASNIIDQLQKSDISVDMFGEGKKLQKKYKWHIFILSDDALKDKEFSCKCESVLADGLYSNQVRMIPLLRNVGVEKVPKFLKWVTLMDAADPRLIQSLSGLIRGK